MTSPPSIFTLGVHVCALVSINASAPAMKVPAFDSMKLIVPVLATALLLWGCTINGGNDAPLSYHRKAGPIDPVAFMA